MGSFTEIDFGAASDDVLVFFELESITFGLEKNSDELLKNNNGLLFILSMVCQL